MTATLPEADIAADDATQDAPPPCVAKPRNKPRCGKPSTHAALFHCPHCGYHKVRALCTRHTRAAEGIRWHCAICKTPIQPLFVAR